MGIDRATFLVGPDGKVKEVWRKVKVPGHVDAVLKAVRAACGLTAGSDAGPWRLAAG